MATPRDGFDPANAGGMTLSNGNKTATDAGTSDACRAIASTGTTGKWYWEMTMTTVGSTGTTFQLITANGADIASWSSDGTLGGDLGGTINTFASGNVCSAAIDIGAGLLWFSPIVGGVRGNWDNSPTDNPATGTGGNGITSGLSWFPEFVSGSTANDKATLNTGTSAFAAAIPVGFKPLYSGSDLPDRWMERLSEPVRLPPSRAALQQPVAFVFNPAAEFIGPDKWMQALSEPQRQKPGLGSAQQLASVFTYVPGVVFEFIGPDKYMQALSEPQRQKPGLGAALQSYASAFTFVPGVVFEFIGPDKYMQALSTPLQRPGLSAALQQSLAFIFNPAAEFIGPDKWMRALSEPVRLRQMQPSLQAFTGAFDPNPFVTFSWFAGLSEPVRQKQRLLEAAQQFFAGDTQTIPVSLMRSWFEPLSEPVRLLKGLLASQQAFEAFLFTPPPPPPPSAPLPIGFPIGRFPIGVMEGLSEFIGPDKWMRALSEPVRQKLGLLTAAQAAFFMEPSPVDVFIRWYQQLSEPQRNRLWLLTALQQAWTGPTQLRPTPTVTAVMNAIEQFDAFLGGASVFNTPGSGEIGVLLSPPTTSEIGVIATAPLGGETAIIPPGTVPSSGTPTTPGFGKISVRKV
jgi:hypothetical protein